MQQVHLRVNDAATGKPTPVRLRITDAAGTYYAPFGRLTEFATGVNQDVGGNVMIGAKKWAYIDGACEILLPPGELHIEIAKGFEFKPIDETITLLAGKMSLRFTIERWIDMRKLGWYSGDTRVHYMSPDAALLEGQAEDVAVVNLLAFEAKTESEFGEPVGTIPNILSFSGQSFARQAVGYGVAVNTLNRHPELGDLALLHCHRIVYPLTFGGPDGKEDWTLADWCDQCHRKHGLVVWANPQFIMVHPLFYGAPLAELVLGKIDAFELTDWGDHANNALLQYHRLCEADLMVPLVGASGKTSNGECVGRMTTYACLAESEEFTYANWIRAVRAGRTIVSGGPLLHLTINGTVPSTGVAVQPSEHPLQVRVTAKSWHPFDRLELLWNGIVIADVAASGTPHTATLEQEIAVEKSGWLAARCQNGFAHTSAVAVRKVGSPTWANASVVERRLNDLDRMLVWAKEKARCTTPRDRERLCHVFEEARTILAKKLSPPSA